MAATHIVDHYQLNASIDGGGDSAIVALVQTSGKNPELLSLVLVDGGNGRNTAELIVATLDKIAIKYNASPKLDAVVISQFDAVRHKALSR